jgi:hypothetical protein
MQLASRNPERTTHHATPGDATFNWPRTADKSLVIPAILPENKSYSETYGRIDTIFLFDESL